MFTLLTVVFFDFAFMKKPVIYYHEGNDYHYKDGYFSYEEMGFGDVIDNGEDLVDKVIDYIENNDLEGAVERWLKTSARWKMEWFDTCKEIFDNCNIEKKQ